MPKIEKLMSFEEFRVSEDEALRTQRERLQDDAVAAEVLADGGGASGWRQWDNNVLAFES